MKERLLAYLQREPRGRWRKNKDRAIVNLLIKTYPELEQVRKETLVAVVQDFNSYDRLWRLCMSENPSLQMEDYKDKEILEQEKMLELGYTV